MKLRFLTSIIVVGLLSACDETHDQKLDIEPSASIAERMWALDQALPGSHYEKIARNIDYFGSDIPEFVPSSLQISGSNNIKKHIILNIGGVTTSMRNQDFVLKIGKREFKLQKDKMKSHRIEKEILNGHASIDHLVVAIPDDLFIDFVSGNINAEIHSGQRGTKHGVMVKASKQWAVLGKVDFGDEGVILRRVNPENISLIR